MFGTALALTAIATCADIASLALLQVSMRSLMDARATAGAGSTQLMVFLAVALLGSASRLAAVRKMVAAQYELSSALAIKAFGNLQHQDYADYRREGASLGFAAFDRLQIVSFQALGSIMAGTAAGLSAIALTAAIAVVQPLAGALALVAFIVLWLESGPAGSEGVPGGQSALTRQRARLIYEGRHAFRDIFLTNGQQRVSADFAEVDSSLRRIQRRVVVSAQSSRYTVEIAGFVAALLVLAALGIADAEHVEIVPLLSVLGLGALRLLPQLAVVRSSLRLIAAHGEVTDDVIALLDADRSQAPAAPAVRFTGTIALDDVTVLRADRPDTLTGVDLVIERGQRIGILGASGAGKSTLLDVICGAVKPDSGTVMVDGRAIAAPGSSAAWRSRIGVVSQNPILLGATLREAIVFPQRLAEVDQARFEDAVRRAGVASFAQGFDLGLDTTVGEAVEHLSGGQRQRVALAHALYRAHDLLILDEATGQLDGDSEQAVIEALRDLPRTLTVVIASHREALFHLCDVVYELAGGRLRRCAEPSPGPRIARDPLRV